MPAGQFTAGRAGQGRAGEQGAANRELACRLDMAPATLADTRRRRRTSSSLKAAMKRSSQTWVGWLRFGHNEQGW